MSQLTPCPECQRHIRKTEAQCPFCAAAVSLAHIAPPVLPRKRLGRAATFAFGASVVGVAAAVACNDADEGAAIPVYGAPAAGTAGTAGTAAEGGATGMGGMAPTNEGGVAGGN